MAKQTTKNRGRPTVMTQATVEKLEVAFSWGCTDEEACLFAEINKQTLYNYQDKNPQFLDRKELLKTKTILLARSTVVKAIEGDPYLALKYLERKKKDEFAPRSEVTGRDGGPIEFLSDEQAKKAAKALIDSIDIRKEVLRDARIKK